MSSPTVLRRTISVVGLCTLPLLVAGQNPGTPPPVSEVEAIRREMQQLREDYERRLQLLDQRLRQLEQSTPVPPVTAAVPIAPVTPVPSTNVVVLPPDSVARTAVVTREVEQVNAAEKVREFADSEFAENTSTRDYALSLENRRTIKERVEQVLNDFIEIGGYFRAGYGRDDQGGPQVAFQAPGAPAKYRLGNEAENYGEIIFAKNFYTPGLFSADPQERPDGTPAGPVSRVQVRLSIYNPYTEYGSSSSTQFGLPEAWGAIGNVLQGQPGLTFWAGNRFYRRFDISINDFFFYNMSGGGAGLEDLDLGFGKFAFAWLGGSSQSAFYNSVPQPEPDDLAAFSKGNFDFRLYDTSLPLGKGEFGFTVSRASAGLDVDGRTIPSQTGVALNFVHTAEKFLDSESINRFSLQAGNGPARTFTSTFETFTTPVGTFIDPGGSDSWRFRATESLVIQPIPELAIGPAMVFQHTAFGEDGGGGEQDWFSIGVRPVWFFNRYFSTALETGIDWVSDSQQDTSGYLWKATLAPQISLGDHFYSRPSLRVFVTYARWSSEFIGQVGGPDYVTDDWGLTYGVQMEAWW
ncbi:MAG: carbohydrate porin [Verrucomicrobia bacterium]|nr:carbohydrate porin [Verrucomicrobiota bacterium]